MRDSKIVRNPVLTLPCTRQALDLSAESKAFLRALLRELSREAGTRAEMSWKKGKAPIAAYWKAVAVYARHAAILLK
ncbi:MAG: hypothetical protein ACRD2O_18055 [Terriglobia bacterium]